MSLVKRIHKKTEKFAAIHRGNAKKSLQEKTSGRLRHTYFGPVDRLAVRGELGMKRSGRKGSSGRTTLAHYLKSARRSSGSQEGKIFRSI